MCIVSSPLGLQLGLDSVLNLTYERLASAGISLPSLFALLHIYTLNLPERLGDGLLAWHLWLAVSLPV